MTSLLSCITDQVPDLGFLHSKVSYDTILRENDLTGDLRGRNVLVTGGTNGIGAAAAVAFAKRGANIYIAGRKPDAAAEVIAKARDASRYPQPPADGGAGQIFEFHPFNAVLIADNKRFVVDMSKIFEERGGLDILVMTQGGLGSGVRKETEEGHEWNLALQDFSRYIVAVGMMPLLQRSPHGGVILDVLAAGVWNSMDLHNMELYGKSPDFFHVASRDGVTHDVMTLEFNERCPGVKYNHLYPGLVKTSIRSAADVTGIIGTGFGVVNAVTGVTPEHYAEIIFNVGTKWEKARTPSEECRSWGATGERVKIRDFPKSKEARDTIWGFLERETDYRLAEPGHASPLIPG